MEEICKKITKEILEDLEGRRGFRDMVRDLDEDVIDEILDAWENIINSWLFP